MRFKMAIDVTGKAIQENIQFIALPEIESRLAHFFLLFFFFFGESLFLIILLRNVNEVIYF